jgi:bifunctional DNA-binding transcriptional regulator/antitoxin component of YhaV-PrlF toxin-antitoxin module
LQNRGIARHDMVCTAVESKRARPTGHSPVCYAAHRSKLDFLCMTVLVKNKPGLTVPQAIQKKAGIRPGDLIEFTAAKGTITIRTAKPPDESRYPLYTPTNSSSPSRQEKHSKSSLTVTSSASSTHSTNWRITRSAATSNTCSRLGGAGVLAIIESSTTC